MTGSHFFDKCAAPAAGGIAFHEAQPPLAPAKDGARRRGRERRRTGHNLVLRLLARKQDTPLFLIDPAVPFTNNQAEQGGRMMKLRQKISDGFRSQHGANDFAVIRSFISTARKQVWNVIQALMLDSANLLARLRTARAFAGAPGQLRFFFFFLLHS